MKYQDALLTDKEIKEAFASQELDKYPFMESLRAIAQAQLAKVRIIKDKEIELVTEIYANFPAATYTQAHKLLNALFEHLLTPTQLKTWQEGGELAIAVITTSGKE